MSARVLITIDRHDQSKSKIEIAGHDLANIIHGFVFDATANGPSHLRIDFIPEYVEIIAEADVTAFNDKSVKRVVVTNKPSADDKAKVFIK